LFQKASIDLLRKAPEISKTTPLKKETSSSQEQNKCARSECGFIILQAFSIREEPSTVIQLPSQEKKRSSQKY